MVSLGINGGSNTQEPLEKSAGMPTSLDSWTGVFNTKSQQLQYLQLLTLHFFVKEPEALL